MNPKGFGFGVVRKPAKKRRDVCHVESATGKRCAMRIFYCQKCPAWSGGRQLYNRGFPKAGGVMLFCDFLNPPDRQISLAVHF